MAIAGHAMIEVVRKFGKSSRRAKPERWCRSRFKMPQGSADLHGGPAFRSPHRARMALTRGQRKARLFARGIL